MNPLTVLSILIRTRYWPWSKLAAWCDQQFAAERDYEDVVLALMFCADYDDAEKAMDSVWSKSSVELSSDADKLECGLMYLQALQRGGMTDHDVVGFFSQFADAGSLIDWRFFEGPPANGKMSARTVAFLEQSARFAEETLALLAAGDFAAFEAR